MSKKKIVRLVFVVAVGLATLFAPSEYKDKILDGLNVLEQVSSIVVDDK